MSQRFNFGPDPFYRRIVGGGPASILAAVLAFLIVVGFVVGLYAGFTILLGWIGFLLYRHFAPETFPYIGLWAWVGITFLVNIFLRAFRVRMNQS